MAKAAKKLPQPKQSINEEFLDAVDELHVAKHMFDCAFLAVDGSGLDIQYRNAIQSVLSNAQQILEAGIEKVERLQKVQS